MPNVFHRGYAVRFILEAATLPDAPLDENRYYKVDATVAEDAVDGVAQVLQGGPNGETLTRLPVALRMLETRDDLNSQQAATLFLAGGSPLAELLRQRVRNMDHLRIELSMGTGWRLAFDGFVSMSQRTLRSGAAVYANDLTIQGRGTSMILDQSWFNWQGAIRPAEDVFTGAAGQSLYQQLTAKASMTAPELIKAFLSAGTGILKVRAGDEPIFPGDFFEFATGGDFQSAFDTAYPFPAMTYVSYQGPLWGLVRELAEPDLHECFFTYRDNGSGREKPTLIFRPRPFPGAVGDDGGWKALPVHTLDASRPVAKSIMAERQATPHFNAFHWACAEADSSFGDQGSKMLFGFWVDQHSIDRYGYAAKPVATMLPPLGAVGDKKKPWIDTMQKLVERVAYQEAPMPELLSRSLQLPGWFGVHPGEVLEDYSDGEPVTGYLSTVSHRFTASPFTVVTTLGVVRAYPSTAETYPDRVRRIVDIQRVPYVVGTANGSAPDQQLAAVQTAKPPANCACAGTHPSMPNVPYGQLIVQSAKAKGLPPWVLAHLLRCESSIGANPGMNTPGASGDLGIAQFTPIAVKDLYNLGYRNADGSAFTHPLVTDLAAAQGNGVLDPCLAIPAAAHYLQFISGKVRDAGLYQDLAAVGGGYAGGTFLEDSLYAWTLYGYNRGWPTALLNGKDQHWVFSQADRAFQQFLTYWGNAAVQNGRATFGGLG